MERYIVLLFGAIWGHSRLYQKTCSDSVVHGRSEARWTCGTLRVDQITEKKQKCIWCSSERRKESCRISTVISTDSFTSVFPSSTVLVFQILFFLQKVSFLLFSICPFLAIQLNAIFSGWTNRMCTTFWHNTTHFAWPSAPPLEFTCIPFAPIHVWYLVRHLNGFCLFVFFSTVLFPEIWNFSAMWWDHL